MEINYIKASDAVFGGGEQSLGVTKVAADKPVKKDETKKVALALAGLAAIGAAAVGITIAVKRGKAKEALGIALDAQGGKAKEGADELLKLADVKFSKGVATLSDNGEKLSGKIQHTTKDGANIVMEYKDGLLVRSTKNIDPKSGKLNVADNFEKIYSRSEDGKLNSVKKITQHLDGHDEHVMHFPLNGHITSKDGTEHIIRDGKRIESRKIIEERAGAPFEGVFTKYDSDGKTVREIKEFLPYNAFGERFIVNKKFLPDGNSIETYSLQDLGVVSKRALKDAASKSGGPIDRSTSEKLFFRSELNDAIMSGDVQDATVKTIETAADGSKTITEKIMKYVGDSDTESIKIKDKEYLFDVGEPEFYEKVTKLNPLGDIIDEKITPLKKVNHQQQ